MSLKIMVDLPKLSLDIADHCLKLLNHYDTDQIFKSQMLIYFTHILTRSYFIAARGP